MKYRIVQVAEDKFRIEFKERWWGWCWTNTDPVYKTELKAREVIVSYIKQRREAEEAKSFKPKVVWSE